MNLLHAAVALFRKSLFKTLLLALLLFTGASSVWAQDVQKIPALTGHVVDTTGLLDASQQAALEAKLEAFEKAKKV